MSMRRAASCCQPLQLISLPRGARTGRGPLVGAVVLEVSSLGMAELSFERGKDGDAGSRTIACGQVLSKFNCFGADSSSATRGQI